MWLLLGILFVSLVTGQSNLCVGRPPNNGVTLLWHAPISSANGFGNEAVEYVSSIHGFLHKRNRKNGSRKSSEKLVTRVCWVQHGDIPVTLRGAFFAEDVETLASLSVVSKNQLLGDVVSVCHSTPPAWSTAGAPDFDPVLPCPLVPSLLVIGRSMFESSDIPDRWIPRLEALSDLWLPTNFHVESFSNASDKLKPLSFVIPESIRIHPWQRPLRHHLRRRLMDYFFDGISYFSIVADLQAADALPALWEELLEDGYSDREIGESVLAAESRSWQLHYREHCKKLFLSVFKWETRKGIDVLLQAFLEEFVEDHDVCLILKAPEPSQDGADDAAQGVVRQYACPRWRQNPTVTNQQYLDLYCSRSTETRLIRVLDVVIPTDLMPFLYSSSDCIVAPSRGEGWGRPVMEAMAVGIPVIATNWSGTATLIAPDMNGAVALPLNYELERGIDGRLYAEPSVPHLKQLLRWVHDHPVDARRIGVSGRQKVEVEFSADRIAEMIVRRVEFLLRR